MAAKCILALGFSCYFCIACGVGSASGQSATFLIDEELSFLEILPGQYKDDDFTVDCGTMYCQTLAIIEQQPGSLRTMIGGELVGSISGQTLTFAGGSAIDPLPNAVGPFSPTGSPGAEDNFGGTAIVNTLPNPFTVGDMALRDATADIVLGSVTIDTMLDSLLFSLTAGVLEHDVDMGNLVPLASVKE